MTCYYTGDAYWYSYGHKTRAAAEIALEIAHNSGDVLPGERADCFGVLMPLRRKPDATAVLTRNVVMAG